MPKIRYYVDIPNSFDIDDSMVNLASFDTREDALAFCKKHFGTDDGTINLISEVDDSELFDEEDDDQ